MFSCLYGDPTERSALRTLCLAKNGQARWLFFSERTAEHPESGGTDLSGRTAESEGTAMKASGHTASR